MSPHKLTEAELDDRRAAIAQHKAEIGRLSRVIKHLSAEIMSGYLAPEQLSLTPRPVVAVEPTAEDAAELDKAAGEAVAAVAPKHRAGAGRAAHVRYQVTSLFTKGEETWTLAELVDLGAEVTAAEYQAALDALAAEGLVERKAGGRYYWRKKPSPEPSKGKGKHRDTKPEKAPTSPAKGPAKGKGGHLLPGEKIDFSDGKRKPASKSKKPKKNLSPAVSLADDIIDVLRKWGTGLWLDQTLLEDDVRKRMPLSLGPSSRDWQTCLDRLVEAGTLERDEVDDRTNYRLPAAKKKASAQDRTRPLIAGVTPAPAPAESEAS